MHDDEVGALDIGAAQHLWIDRDAYRIGARAEPRGALVLDHVELGERVELLVRKVHQLPARHRPLPAAIDRGRVRRIERCQRPPLQLPDVPVGVGEREVDDRHVFADAFDFLGVPQRERVVVARGDEHAVGLHRL